MTLTLTVLRCPEPVALETRRTEGGELSIGRAPDNDWVLPDPERDLSKHHCVLAYRSGGWQILDLSANGTFLNRNSEPVGRDRSHPLNDGDRLGLGPYEIEVRIGEAPAFASRRGADPFSLDPFASRPSFEPDPLLAREQERDSFGQAVAPASIKLPPDYDPLARDPADAPMAGPTIADHSPHLDDALRPPRVVLPEDWDRDFLAGSPAAPRVAAPSIATPPSAKTVLVLQPGPVIPPPSHAPAARPPTSATAAPPPISATAAPPTTRGPKAPLPDHAMAPPPPSPDLLDAFLRGAGLQKARLDDPEATMERLGAAFRAFVSGLRQALIARGAIKGEFRIPRTMIQRTGNNPLKFSADDDDAIVALIGYRRTDMGAPDAVAEALRDIRLHELATIRAMQSAVGALLAELDPSKLRSAAEHGGRSLFAAQKKANAWDAYEALYARTFEAVSDNFDSVFGKAFAQAYERAMAEAVRANEPS
jgi:type VI secretion system protein ImpI/type VI secretion system protein